MPRTLNDWHESYMQYCDDSEPPTLYHEWCGIATIAAALQRKCRLVLSPELIIWSNLYVVLVGPAATGKGTAMKFAESLQTEIKEIRLTANATSMQALIKRLQEANIITEMPDGSRMAHSSLSVFSAEFTVFIGYKQSAMIAALCDWFDCHDRWVYDTISRSKEEIHGLWLNLIGATTPETLLLSLPIEAIGGGLTSRIIFVVERKRRKIVIFPKPDDKVLRANLIHDLQEINALRGNFTFTKEAAGIYTDFSIKNAEDPPFQGDLKLEHYVGRRRRHLLATAMAISAGRSNSLIISGKDMADSIDLLTRTESKMHNLFRGIDSPYASMQAEIEDWIRENSPTDLPSVFLQFKHIENRIVVEILSGLERARLIQQVFKGTETEIRWNVR